MSDERAFELLSAAADDDLTAAEQAELEKLLRELPQAENLKADMDQLEEIMANVADVDPPSRLRDEIMQAASLPQPSAKWSFADWLHPIRSGAVLRYGFSAAIGALLVIAVYEGQPHLGPITDITELVGTMAPDSGGVGRSVLDTFSFERTGVSSIVRLEQRDDALVLDVRIDTTRPVEISMDFAAAGLEVEALAQTQSSFESIQFADNVLKVKGRGKRRFSVLLHARDDTSSASNAEIALEFSSDGKLLQQGSLNSIR